MDVHRSPYFLNPPFTQQIETYPAPNYPLLPHTRVAPNYPNYPNYLLSHSQPSHLSPLSYSQPAPNYLPHNVRHPEVHDHQAPQPIRSVKPLMTDHHEVLTADMVLEILSNPMTPVNKIEDFSWSEGGNVWVYKADSKFHIEDWRYGGHM